MPEKQHPVYAVIKWITRIPRTPNEEEIVQFQTVGPFPNTQATKKYLKKLQHPPFIRASIATVLEENEKIENFFLLSPDLFANEIKKAAKNLKRLQH